MAEVKDTVAFYRGWKKSDAGGWNNVDIDNFIWCPCDTEYVFETLKLWAGGSGATTDDRTPPGGTVTCPHCGRKFRAVVSIVIEEQEATNG